MSDEPKAIVALTAVPDAIERFNRALTYAEAVLRGVAEANDAPDTRAKITEHAEWLAWGQGRIAVERKAQLDTSSPAIGDPDEEF